MPSTAKDTSIAKIRRHLKQKIMCPQTKFRHHVSERLRVTELFQRTVETAESNSALLIGPRSSGKTTLVNNVLDELNEDKAFRDNVLIVNLHGFVHTDDRLALKDITRQMQLENVVEDKVFGTFAENLTFLLDCLKSGDKKRSMPVIFILDEFDLFCAHHNQTLLYNLFDIAQSAQAPICVLGITCRLDVIELLEKRVKSRFSHRQIFLFPGDTSGNQKPISAFDDRIELARDLLSITNNKEVPSLSASMKKTWNENINKLLKNATINTILKRMHQIDTSERHFRNFLTVLVSCLTENHEKLEIDDFSKANKLFSEDDKVLLLEGLSVLEICLIIAMKHENEILDGEPMNFEMILSRYNKFVSLHSSIESVQRPVIMKAFEHIKNLELIAPVSGASTRIEKEYQLYKFLLTPRQVMEAVKNFSGLPTEVSQWASNSFQ